MATSRIPLSRVLEHIDDDTAAGPVAVGCDDLGTNSDYDYDSDSSVEGINFIDYSQSTGDINFYMKQCGRLAIYIQSLCS